MPDVPKAKEGDWIEIGAAPDGIDAILVHMNTRDSLDHPQLAQVVFLQHGREPIRDSVRWNGTAWEWLHEGPSGMNIERDSNYRGYILRLRKGRYHQDERERDRWRQSESGE